MLVIKLQMAVINPDERNRHACIKWTVRQGKIFCMALKTNKAMKKV